MILDPEEAFNSTDDDIMDDDDPSMDKPHFQMPYAADVSWTVVFSIMITCAILGNLVVFWIVLGKWIQCYQLFVKNELCRYRPGRALGNQMGKFRDFSASQISRETNSGHLETPKTDILTIWAALNFESIDIFKYEIFTNLKI